MGEDMTTKWHFGWAAEAKERRTSRAGGRATAARALSLFVLALSTIVANDAFASCCRVAKLATEPAARVRVCDVGPSEECGAILWEQDLAPGESREACPSGDRVVYRQWDADLGNFGPATTAVCNGDDVDL